MLLLVNLHISAAAWPLTAQAGSGFPYMRLSFSHVSFLSTVLLK